MDALKQGPCDGILGGPAMACLPPLTAENGVSLLGHVFRQNPVSHFAGCWMSPGKARGSCGCCPCMVPPQS